MLGKSDERILIIIRPELANFSKIMLCALAHICNHSVSGGRSRKDADDFRKSLGSLGSIWRPYLTIKNSDSNASSLLSKRNKTAMAVLFYYTHDEGLDKSSKISHGN